MGSVSFLSCFSILVTAIARNTANTRMERGLRRVSAIRVFCTVCSANVSMVRNGQFDALFIIYKVVQ